jgi:hypothetical protein
MASPNGDEVGVNSFLDVVYKVATRQGEKPIPVGVVSKNYRLVDHHQLLRTVEQALVDNGLDLRAFLIRAHLTLHGERAHFSILFPREQRFTMPVDNKEDDMRFRLEVFNSVEGSCRLMAVGGWLRLVCSNGLIVGTALLHFHQQHRQQLQGEELGRLVGAYAPKAGALLAVDLSHFIHTFRYTFTCLPRLSGDSIRHEISQTAIGENIVPAECFRSGQLPVGAAIEPLNGLCNNMFQASIPR